MSNEIDVQARRVAARVPETVGFDPVILISLITTILPLLMSCFNRNDEPDPAKMRENIRGQNERAPERLRRRTARRIRGESEENLSKAQAFALAEAVIAEALDTDDSTMVSLAAACQDGA